MGFDSNARVTVVRAPKRRVASLLHESATSYPCRTARAAIGFVWRLAGTSRSHLAFDTGTVDAAAEDSCGISQPLSACCSASTREKRRI